MDLTPLAGTAILGVFMLVASRFWPKRKNPINRALASKPRVLVHDAEGTVRLTGRVRRIGELVRAPLSGRLCVAYEVVVKEPSRDVRGVGPSWTSAAGGSCPRPRMPPRPPRADRA